MITHLLRLLYGLFWLGIFFFYIFSPPFQGLPFGADKLIFLGVWGYVVYHFSDFVRFIFVKYILVFVLFLTCATAYSCLRYLFTPYSAEPAYNLGLTCIFYVPFTFVWLNELRLRFFGNYFIHDLMLMGAGVLQSIITSILVFKPALNTYVQTHVLRNAESQFSMVNKAHLNRGYGLGQRLGSSFPLALGLIYSHIIERASRSWFFMLCLLSMPLFLLSILYNARLGMVPILGMGVAFFFLSLWQPLRAILSLLCLLTLGFFFIMAAAMDLHIVDVSVREKFDWFIEAFELIGVLDSGRVTYIDILVSGWVVPDGSQQLFGTGQTLFGRAGGLGADMGYANYVYYGGYALLFLGLAPYFWLFLYPVFRSPAMGVKIVSLVYLGVFLVANFKGGAIYWPDYTKMVILLSFSSYFRINNVRV